MIPIDITKIEQEIVERIKPLGPEKIILFGSHAAGTANEDSDIDLFVIKDMTDDAPEQLQLRIRKRLRDLIYKYNVGFDVLCASRQFLESRNDYFYTVDVLQNGKVLYAS